MNYKSILLSLFCLPLMPLQAAEKTTKPNFIIIFADDLGYGDLGCYGNKKIKTPHIDKMAKEGMSLSSFYAQPVCGPSRAALMTGCYPLRVATKENKVTFHPTMHTKEITIAEVLKTQGYATGCFGKWGLAGHNQHRYDFDLLPTKQGFDYFFGTPGSNDLFINLIRNNKLIEKKADMSIISKRYTDEAISFIQKHKEQPFFVYIPHTMPHIELKASAPFKGKSQRGLYGAVIEEIDFNVGRIVDEVKKLGLEKNTYIIFTSDNGPWFLEKHAKLKQLKDAGGSHGGSSGKLRGHKTSCWEGGVRVPFIIWGPGRIPAGKSSSEIARTLDLFPTLTHLAGGSIPTDRVIDGKDITSILTGAENAKSPSNEYFYYKRTCLMAVRQGDWKLLLPRSKEITDQWAVYHRDEDIVYIDKPVLYNLKNDIGEQTDLAAANPEIVKNLLKLAEKARASIGDYNRIGKEARFFDAGKKRPDIK